MAINIQTLKTRSLTALIFVAVMLVGLLWNFWSFVALFTIIHFGCWYEFLRLIERIHAIKFSSFIKWGYPICGFIFMIFFGIQDLKYNFWLVKLGIEISFKYWVWVFLFLGLVIISLQNKTISRRALYLTIFGFIYISVCFALVLNMYSMFEIRINHTHFFLDGGLLPIFIIFSIWVNDTMAYLVGSFIGKTSLSKISPKKTWEGTIGGALLCIVVMILLGQLWHQHISILFVSIIAALCAIFGTLGDLFESKLKRMANVKDSGSFMPGHGGFLDRFDSLLFAVPVVWVYVKLFL